MEEGLNRQCHNLLTNNYLKLHGADPVKDFSHVLSDHGPGDLVIALSCSFHGVSRHVIEGNHVGQDAHRFIEGTEPESM